MQEPGQMKYLSNKVKIIEIGSANLDSIDNKESTSSFIYIDNIPPHMHNIKGESNKAMGLHGISRRSRTALMRER